MSHKDLSRRDFLRTSAVLTSAALVGQVAGPAGLLGQTTRRSAIDQVTLNQTGIKLSRVGIGTGVNNGVDNMAGGKEAFIKVIRHAYDQGITYIDAAQRYQTFSSIKDAIKGIPREKLFLQSKIWPGDAADVMAAIDNHRKVYDTDYIDSLLIHCRTDAAWTDQQKAMMDVYLEAKEKKWIRANGVSCHSLPALQTAARVDWAAVHLVRINPMGLVMDSRPDMGWAESLVTSVTVQPVLDQIKQMHDKGRGVIGMKIFANGSIKDPVKQEESIRFAMSNPNIDAIVIGMTKTEEIDKNLALINKVLAA